MTFVGAAEPLRETGSPAATEPRSESVLIQCVATGDQVAFAELYDLIIGRVHSVVVSVLRDAAQAEEVTQEVMVEIWRQAPRFDPGRGSVRTWAATMAHRRAVDRVRSSQAARNRDQAEVERSAAEAAPRDVVSEQFEASQDRVRVNAALRELSDTQRESIQLAYFDGHTYSEVAEILATPEGTVKTRIRDGLIRLRSMLEVDDV
jgi:RNA polymerase sigma-70 factor (ECF subfamily)